MDSATGANSLVNSDFTPACLTTYFRSHKTTEKTAWQGCNVLGASAGDDLSSPDFKKSAG